MKKILENPFMKKLQEWSEKVGKNKFLSSLQAAMMGTLGIILVGSIAQILMVFLGPTLLKVISDKGIVYSSLNYIYQFTMNLMSLWVVALFAYNYAKKLDLKAPLMNILDALVCFFLAVGSITIGKTGQASIDMTYLGTQGMFIGFLVVFLSVRIEKVFQDKNIRIKMPDVIPPFLAESFSALLPLLFSSAFFSVIVGAISVLSNGKYTLASGFTMILSYPLKTLTSVPGMIILCTLAAILWCFGIHGTMLISSIVFPLSIQAIGMNAAAHAAGQPMQFYPVFLYAGLSMVGGTGNTLPLVLMGLRSKSEQIRSISRVSLIPSLFNINEPVSFGMPIMYNPILCIPYVLSVPIIMLLTYFGYKSGFIQVPWILIPPMVPIGFQRYLEGLKWQNAIWDYLMIIPATILYYPFFKIYEKQLLEKELKAKSN
ncbi:MULTISPECIES: PTS sugar transporter subunit IIC [unclassified Lactobacillus]|uniref:PTS sugar transporter subunit IIC n=1 Tax=unclassified Lactobacillus TaxID=2620435 RepID=UPI00226A4AE7|nr:MULTISPECIES: PTS transporter subunit EIIC [unclassified Lactobacillus]MCX8720814.1 PTS sugar transporter subunit IIC [Lactobacillus sp. B4010]MCX8732987.1 PTS sugar transporter subunit IIC [Lactobacillus sp. B4015]MCX8735575.1 PTS sugar transporter subunit IIC [Lactobacillus sp. B4012]